MQKNLTIQNQGNSKLIKYTYSLLQEGMIHFIYPQKRADKASVQTGQNIVTLVVDVPSRETKLQKSKEGSIEIGLPLVRYITFHFVCSVLLTLDNRTSVCIFYILSLYISYGSEKENLLNNRERLKLLIISINVLHTT